MPVTEIENLDKPNQHELPVGNDHGYIWRLYSYWTIEERDSGVYVQVESIALTRSIPWVLAWLINPLTRSIPREVLSNLLNGTRTVAMASESAGSRQSEWTQRKSFQTSRKEEGG